MKLDKLKDDRKLEICRKYFYGKIIYCLHLSNENNLSLAGIAFLPFLWLINFIWFFKHAFIRSTYPEQAQIRKC